MAKSKAKGRMVRSRFWSDNWVRKLNALDRYLFLYLLTNEHTNICGIYELPISVMAFESGIDERDLEKSMLPKLAPKVYYIDGWVYLKNFEKHQSDSEDIKIGIDRARQEVPQYILAKIREIDTQGGEGVYTVGDSPTYLNQIQPKLNQTKSNLIVSEDAPIVASPTPADEAKDFFTNPEKQEQLISFLKEKKIDEAIARREVRKFISYWTEPTKSGKKQRWQTEKTFEVNRRIANWFTRVKEYAGNRSELPKGVRLR